MNSSYDPVNFLSCTILGLKTALVEAEKENRNLQKLLLSFYVKDAAKETNLYKMNRTGAKMSEVFQKEKQDLSSKIRDLEARLSDLESENLNLNFQIKELKAFLEEKTNLLELYNPKDAKSEKLILNTLKEKDLVQIIRNVLACMKEGRVSRELRKSLKKLEQRKNKTLKKIKSEDTDAEVSDDEVDLMSTIIENRLKGDQFSIKFEKNESSSFQSIHKNPETPTIDSNENSLTGAETSSSHGNAMDCIPTDQSIFSPFSIADSDYSSNGVKSVESLNLDKVHSAESSSETIISPTEPDAPDSVQQETLPTLIEASIDVTQSDDSVSDVEEILECDKISFLDPEILNSVVDLILDEMINICYSNAIVESFGEFCKNDISLSSSQNISVPLKNTLESPTFETTSFNSATQSVPQHMSHYPIPIKRKADISSPNCNFKKMRLDENSINLSAEINDIAFVSEENTNAKQIPSIADEANENLLKVQNYSANNDIEIYPKLEHQKVSVSKNAIIKDSLESIQSHMILRSPDTCHDIVISSSKNELALNCNKCLETSAEENVVESEIGMLESRPDESVISSLDSQVLQRPIASIFDVETDTTDFQCTSVLDSAANLNKEISIRDDHDNFSESLSEMSSKTVDYSEILNIEVTTAKENNSYDIVPSTPDEIIAAISVEKNFNVSEISIERKSDTDAEQVKDAKLTNEEVLDINETSVHKTGKDLFYILNEFTALKEQMHERITVFREFMLQEENCDVIDMTDEMEYIVVAEILDDSDFELFDHEASIDGSYLPDDIIDSLHKTSLKTVELQTSKENFSISIENISPEEQFIAPAFSSMAEVNDASDDEKDELTIVEDDCVDNPSVVDPAFNEGGVFHHEECHSELVLANVPETLVSDSSDVHSVLKKEQPIKEITNIPRYNFKRLDAASNSACETSRSLCSSPVKNSVHPSERNSDFVTSTVEEPLKTLEMKFYVENQTTTTSLPLYIPVFDEIWSKIKLYCCENSSQVIPDTTELIPCRSSVMNSVSNHRNPRRGLQIRKEKFLNFPLVKTSLEEFLKEKIRNFPLAFNTLSSTVCQSNKTTLCCAITEIVSDSVSGKNVRIKEMILNDFVLLSQKLDRTVFHEFMEALKNYLKKRMWAKDWNVKKNGCSMVSYLRLLSKFFTRLCKSNNDSRSVISLLRESLFSFKFRGHPIAFSVLEEWPEIFPSDPEQRNLIAHIILFSLVNHKMEYNQQLYNVGEVHKLIDSLFNVKLGKKTAEEYAKELMLQFNDNTWNDAITLLCKRQMFAWTYTNVIMKYLLPILKKWKTEHFSEEVLNKVLLALRTLLESCPVSKEENEMYKLNLIVNTLEEILLSEKGSRELKETVILVLCDLSSFRFSPCIKILSNWKPDDEVIRLSTFQQLQDRMLSYSNRGRLLNSKKKFQNTREKTKVFNGLRSGENLRPENTNSVIAVGVTKKMNKNRPNAKEFMKNKPIPNGGKKKKKKKRKTK